MKAPSEHSGRQSKRTQTILAVTTTILCLCLLVFVLLMIIGTLKFSCNEIDEQSVENFEALEWWKKTNFYHIYIRSFKDSNGDGQGDLRGIIQKLDYLKEIGVETILLSPFYSSPQKDGGYDIDNYYDTTKMYGNLKDIVDLFDEAHKRDMKVVVDFVPNHTSNLHPWFKYSERALIEPKYEQYKDYYVWVSNTTYLDPQDNKMKPNNWVSNLGNTSSWAWSDIRKQFYLHIFLAEQPDLNYHNQLVRDEMRKIVRYWFRLGADGLRVDAISYSYEDEFLRDEPLNPSYNPNNPSWTDYDKLLHIYTFSLPESRQLVRDWMNVAAEHEFKGKNKVIITESYDTHDKTIQSYGPTPGYRLCDSPFTFFLLRTFREGLLFKDHYAKPGFIANELDLWYRHLRNMHWPLVHGARDPWSVWVISNHDNVRPRTRLGPEGAVASMYLTHLLHGSPVNYYGDELVASDINLSKVPEKTKQEGDFTRVQSRGLMAWTADEKGGAGFSSNDSVWVPPPDDFKERNVETQLRDYKNGKRNELGQFIKLLNIRKNYMKTVVFSEIALFDNKDPSSSLLTVARVHRKLPNLLILINFNYDNQTTVDLKQNFRNLRDDFLTSPQSMYEDASILPTSGLVLLANFETDTIKEGNRIQISGLVLEPSQAVVLQIQPVTRYFNK